ncbi:metallophosphoesterase family protein [uncultured Desulfosarcina sp.]|uniref:metallophosphoesterase family protein n=1 Tax=uncultured Desulfosarcina sp. TaxID=218289 RepID=UPI0029C6E7B0|nr:metallophosphoesterase family protein [uncultured Desulfosarcina sp.]
MKVAILSDIHGNFEALKSVYADIQQNDVDNLLCLGDMVGYGPEPEEVVNFMVEKGIVGVMGNHELATLEDARLEEMSGDARASILITRNLVSDNTLALIEQLPRYRIMGDMRFVHGMPPDSATTYLNWLGDGEIAGRMRAVPQRMIFVGHTHRPISYSLDAINLDVIILQAGKTRLRWDLQHLVNVGSVGQPRDDDARARYVIYDTETDEIDLRFVAYDIQKTVDRIIALGFPTINAQRLFPKKRASNRDTPT